MDLQGKDSGRIYTVGREVARAGEGILSETRADPSLLLKVFNTPLAARPIQKIDILARYPHRPTNVALPREMLLNPATRAVVGYVQPYYRGTVPVARLLDPKYRKKHKVRDDIFGLVRLARALAEALDGLHRTHLVMGDVSDSNFLIGFRRWAGTPVVYVVDGNSFQVSGRTAAGFATYPSGVATEAYAAPEVQGTDWGTSARSVFSDVFGFGVLGWELLFQRSHPFAVVTPADEDPPPLGRRIERRLFPFQPASPLLRGWKPAPLTPGLEVLPAEVRELFFRTFAADDPRDRPLVAAWSSALRRWEETLHPSVGMQAARLVHRGFADSLTGRWPKVRPWATRIALAAGVVAFAAFGPNDVPVLRTVPSAVPPCPVAKDPSGSPTRQRVVDETVFPGDIVTAFFPRTGATR